MVDDAKKDNQFKEIEWDYAISEQGDVTVLVVDVDKTETTSETPEQ